MLRYRLLSAFLIISASLVFVALDSQFPIPGCDGLWMSFVGIYLIFGSAVECVQMMHQSDRSGLRSVRLPALLGVGGIILASLIPMCWLALTGEEYPADCLLGKLGWPLAAMLIAQFLCVVWYFPSYSANSNFLTRAITASWVSNYFGGCFAFAVALRMVGTPVWGLYLLVGIILITKFADAGAYFAGRALGRTKLCPHISPGKTVEGLCGGAIVATIAGWIYFCLCGNWLFPTLQVGWLGVSILGIALTVSGVVGDLVESVFKREMKVKDSGRLLPGLGGLWDVTDSLLPSFVVGYVVVMTDLIQGPGQ
ncbi:MAG: phosphatidate cytidylyltransferase [Aureliella sp.]